MFKKRKTKKRRARTDLPSTDTGPPSDADARADVEDGGDVVSHHDLLAATRAEQGERKKRRTAIRAGASALVGDAKPRRSNKKVLGSVSATADLDDNEDKDMQAFIAERIGSAVGNLPKKLEINGADGSTAISASSSASGDLDVVEAYEILRRQTKTLAAEAGGASDIAGSGIAGIGIFEVSLPDSERQRNAQATAAAVASAMAGAQSQSSGAFASLPASYSGNFVKTGKLMYRQPAVRMADGKISSRGMSSTDKPRDRESLRNFRNNDRR